MTDPMNIFNYFAIQHKQSYLKPFLILSRVTKHREYRIDILDFI